MKTRLAMPPCASTASPFPDLRRNKPLQPMHIKPLNVMKAQFSTNAIFSLALGLLLTGITAPAATRYVWQESPSPGPPFATWSTAAHIIQDAVEAAQPGDTVRVTNGVYDRVIISKAITVESVMGSEVTVIDGGGAGRCATLETNTVLRGFTLRNGRATEGGGVYGGTLYNCTLSGNSVDGFHPYGGGAFGSTLYQCRLNDNAASATSGERSSAGGGAYGSRLFGCILATNRVTASGKDGDAGGGGAAECTLFDCTLTGNSASVSGDESGAEGGGAWDCTLHRCILVGNVTSATSESGQQNGASGGGASGSTLYDCLLDANVASVSSEDQGAAGGGASSSALVRCTLSGNRVVATDEDSGGDGGGAYWSTLTNCTLMGNSASFHGGGAYYGILNNCTLTGNSALSGGGGAYYATLQNCILYFNTASSGSNYVGGTLNSCCTTPLPAGGVGNITDDPLFVDRLNGNLHLQSNSPCINAGNNDFITTPVDLDGNERIVGGLVDMGAYEWVAAPTHYVSASSTNPVSPYRSWSTAAVTIQDAVDAAASGDVIVVTNGVYAKAGRAVAGTMTNRVAVDKLLTVRSLNGPEFTVIEGYQVPGTTNGDGAIRCVYLTSGASLSGFTLTNGAARASGDWSQQSGGGLWCEFGTVVISNCIIAGNSAGYGGGAYQGTLYDCTLSGNSAGTGGGGAYQGTLYDCTLSGNSAGTGGGGAKYATLYDCLLSGNTAALWGGGADESTLSNCTLSNNVSHHGGAADECTLDNCLLTGNAAARGGGDYGSVLRNCTLTGNSAEIGGGAHYSTLNNCIVFSNTATNGANYYQDQYGGVLNYCCTTPLPTNGVSNITSEPLFVDYAGGNLRLQSNSPCINAGNNAYVSSGTDLDGLPRIVGGTVDMGAYEFQSPASVICYAWLQQYGLPTDGSADTIDSDGDRLNNWQEWCCRTDPTNALSVLRLLPPESLHGDVNLSWQSVAGLSYFLERSTNLAASPAFLPLATNLTGQAGTTTYTETNATGAPPRFYRVGVSGQ
jgi:hypothetical protein